MTIYGGARTAKRYGCGDRRKRGTCENKLSLREELARKRILSEVRTQLLRPECIDYVRTQLARRLGYLNRNVDAALQERAERLVRTEERIAGLIGFNADDDKSEYIADALRDLGATAREEKQAIARLQAQAQLLYHCRQSMK